MEAGQVNVIKRKRAVTAAILFVIGGAALLAGFAWSSHAFGADSSASSPPPASKKSQSSKVLYPDKTELDFEGTQIEGELRNPGEFYFQHRNEEKFDSLVKRRKNFHKEMLRDVVLSK